MPQPTRLLNEVFNRHYQDLVAWCRGHVQHELGDPEEFVHTAYLRCRQCWSPQRKSARNEAAYLYRALRWVVVDALRRHGRQKCRTWVLPAPNTGTRWMVLHTLIAREAVSSLKGRQLQVCLALLAGKSDDQIRNELDLSRRALAVYICRARANLCRTLGVAGRRRGWRKPRRSAQGSANHACNRQPGGLG